MILKHEGDTSREFYSKLPRPVRVGIEATGSKQWFLNLMEELGIECQVGHPAQIRAAEPRKPKRDRRDAELILKLQTRAYTHQNTISNRADLELKPNLQPTQTIDANFKSFLDLTCKILLFRSEASMKRLALFVLAFAVATGSAAVGEAASSTVNRFVHAHGRYLVDPEGHTLQLRGINLGNWLVPEGYMFGLDGGPASPREIETFLSELIGPAEAEQFWQAYREAYITEEDIHFLRQTGVNSIRIPLHYKFFIPGNDEGFALLDRVAGWAEKYHMYVVLDLHCAPGGQTGTNIDDSWGYPWLYESEASQAMTVAVWKRIAAHYRDNSTVLGYDLLNEPIPHFPELQKYNNLLEPLYKRLTTAIRTADTNHLIILGGAQWDSNFAVFGAPFDSNLMYTFHKYWTAPTEEVIQPYLDFRNRYNIPIWLGESGENTDAWIHDFVQVLEKDEIGWAFWPYKKMDSASSFVTWRKPAYWDEIIAYGRIPGNTGDTEKRIAARPSLEHARAAFQSLLENVRLAHCQTNAGYIRALNLTVPSNELNRRCVPNENSVRPASDAIPRGEAKSASSSRPCLSLANEIRRCTRVRVSTVRTLISKRRGEAARSLVDSGFQAARRS